MNDYVGIGIGIQVNSSRIMNYFDF